MNIGQFISFVIAIHKKEILIDGELYLFGSK